MNIRAATTFLSITNPRPGQPSRIPTSDPAHDALTDLNRTATLFVTKAKADVAAIVISHKGGSGVQAVGTVTEIDQVLATKNSTAKGQKLLPPTISRPSSHNRFGLDWLKAFLKAGPLTPANHAHQLQTLCNIYVDANTVDEKRAVLTELRHFTLLQCQPKIQQRLTISLHPRCREKFLGLFRDGAITRAELSKNFLPNPFFKKVRKAKRNDSLPPLMKEVTGYTFNLDSFGGVILDKTSIFHYHEFVAFFMNRLDDQLSLLANYRDTMKNKKGMAVLGDLLHRSDSFHIYIHQPSIASFLKRASYDSFSFFMPQDIRNNLEDEGVLFSREAVHDDPVRCFLKWLGLVVQWTEATFILTKTLKQKVSIMFVDNPANSNTKMQACLDDLLHWVLDDSDDFERIKKAIQAKAAQKVEEDEAWLALTVENWDKWGDKFTGKVHCETLLAFLKALEYDKVDALLEPAYKADFQKLLAELQGTKNMMGVSKACCLMCEGYIGYIQPDLKVQGTTGKIFPWPLPELEVDEVVVEHVLSDLKKLVWRLLFDLDVFAIDRRLSGSDDGEDELDVDLGSLA
ncbi:hypothetical protein BGX38DRAFT_1277036 [Terfezia claveryi]|nr:hypothetical protein BGX38DRAFT_1277036 [Terfezia claveryi]